MAVIAKQGTERIWHFAHAQAVNCEEGYIRSVYEAAIDMIKLNPWLLVSGMTVTASGFNAFRQQICEEVVLMAEGEVSLSEIRVNQTNVAMPETLLATISGSPVIIEISIDRRLSDRRKIEYQKLGAAVLEVDLTRFRSEQASRDALEKALFGLVPPASWASLPEIEAATVLANTNLSARLEVDRVRHEAWRADRYAANAAVRQAMEFETIQTRLAHPERRVMWRASLPSQTLVASCVQTFALANGLNIDVLLERFAKIESRGWLTRIKPEDFIRSWSMEIGVSESDFALFLFEAKYIL